jgi:hypothetical protein
MENSVGKPGRQVLALAEADDVVVLPCLVNFTEGSVVWSAEGSANLSDGHANVKLRFSSFGR